MKRTFQLALILCAITLFFAVSYDHPANAQIVSGTQSTTVNSTASTNVTTTSGSTSVGNILGLPLPGTTILVNASSSVAGVEAYGNGTITTSINGVAMSFWFDPHGSDGHKTKPSPVSLTVNAQDLGGKQIPGMYIELQDQNGHVIKTGDTPVTFSVDSGKNYIVYASNYQNIVFDHWDDGTTNPARQVTPTQDMTLTAFYSTGAQTGAPQPPTGLMATAVSSSEIDLRWNAPASNGGSQITGYKIERSADNGATWSTLVASTGSASTAYSDTGLGPGTSYSYRVSAINANGTSPPSSPASATTAQPGQTINPVHSGLVASDSLTNETRTQQQLQAEHGYWFYGGDAPNENATYSYYRDTGGFHIGLQAPSDGTWAGFYGVSPASSATLWHAKIINPARTTKTQFYENGLYVQTANGNVSYVTCVTLTNTQATAWAVINATGDTTQIKSYEVLYFDQSANQPLSRDCTIITNGNNFLQVYLDGTKVYENQNGNLQMPPPFNAFLEPQTSDGQEFLVGSYQNYYVTDNGNVQMTNLPSNAQRVDIVDSTGNVLATGAASAGSATLDVAKFNFPLSADIKVYNSANGVIASTHANIYGGDVYSVSATTVQPQQGILLANTKSTSGTASNTMTLQNFDASSGNDRLLVVGVSANNNNAASVTFGGVPLTKIASSFFNNDAEFWYLKNPGGTGNIAVKMNGPTQAVVGAYQFSGVDQNDPVPTHVAKHNSSPGSPAISITTKYANDWVLDLPSIYGGSTLSGATCTHGWNVNIPNAITGASSTVAVPSPGTASCNWTANVGDFWDDLAIELNAVG